MVPAFTSKPVSGVGGGGGGGRDVQTAISTVSMCRDHQQEAYPMSSSKPESDSLGTARRSSEVSLSPTSFVDLKDDNVTPPPLSLNDPTNQQNRYHGVSEPLSSSSPSNQNQSAPSDPQSHSTAQEEKEVSPSKESSAADPAPAASPSGPSSWYDHVKRTTTRRIPCKARGLNESHNSDTAYFLVPPNAPHGLLLRCSHPACAASNRRFRYCKKCEIPAAERNFIRLHGHGILTTFYFLDRGDTNTSPTKRDRRRGGGRTPPPPQTVSSSSFHPQTPPPVHPIQGFIRPFHAPLSSPPPHMPPHPLPPAPPYSPRSGTYFASPPHHDHHPHAGQSPAATHYRVPPPILQSPQPPPHVIMRQRQRFDVRYNPTRRFSYPQVESATSFDSSSDGSTMQPHRAEYLGSPPAAPTNLWRPRRIVDAPLPFAPPIHLVGEGAGPTRSFPPPPPPPSPRRYNGTPVLQAPSHPFTGAPASVPGGAPLLSQEERYCQDVYAEDIDPSLAELMMQTVMAEEGGNPTNARPSTAQQLLKLYAVHGSSPSQTVTTPPSSSVRAFYNSDRRHRHDQRIPPPPSSSSNAVPSSTYQRQERGEDPPKWPPLEPPGRRIDVPKRSPKQPRSTVEVLEHTRPCKERRRSPDPENEITSWPQGGIPHSPNMGISSAVPVMVSINNSNNSSTTTTTNDASGGVSPPDSGNLDMETLRSIQSGLEAGDSSTPLADAQKRIQKPDWEQQLEQIHETDFHDLFYY